jgi:hypothetical protein
MKTRLPLFVLLAWIMPVALGQPKLAVESMEIDLGTMYNGTTKTGKISIKNIGTQPLKIIRVQPSCGCTTIKQPKSELTPGENDVIEVALNTTGFRGKVEKYVNIETNDPTSQYIAVRLIAEVKEDLTPTNTSSSVWLGNIVVGKSAQQVVTLANTSSKAIVVKEITSASGVITAKADKSTIAVGDTLRVTIKVTADKEGYVNDHLVIQTDSKNQPSVELKIYFIGSKEQQ